MVKNLLKEPHRRSNMKYDVTVTGLGPMAMEFLDPAMEMQFVILFNNDAPAELAELAILHTPGELKEAPAPGDTMRIGEKTYTITAVGDEAIQTLATLGHCTLAFSADSEPYRPGCIMLDGEVVTAEDVVDGAVIQIF
jgi:PTS system glucitol/sorbitol-specific IIA component